MKKIYKKKSENLDFYKIFKPELTPKRMMELGVFGGAYFGLDVKEYPKTWFKNVKLSKSFDVNLNRYKIVSGFKDALTRQVAESVRIERAGPNILNSKSEFSRCRIPRLKIDMEGWKMNQNQNVKKDEAVEKEIENEDDEALGSIEEEVRRAEAKRKAEDGDSKKKEKNTGYATP